MKERPPPATPLPTGDGGAPGGQVEGGKEGGQDQVAAVEGPCQQEGPNGEGLPVSLSDDDSDVNGGGKEADVGPDEGTTTVVETPAAESSAAATGLSETGMALGSQALPEVAE